MFFIFFVFLYILNIASAIEKISASELRAFICENYYERIGFVKERSYYSTNCLKKNPDPSNAKGHYQSFTQQKNMKSVKQ